MPRKAKRRAGRWDAKLQPQLEAAERQAWLAIFEAGVTLTDPSDKDACAPTLRVAIGPELRLDPFAIESCDWTLSPLRLAIGPRLHGMRAFACMRLHAHHVCTAHSAHVQAGVVRARACFDDGDAHQASVP